MNGSFKNSSALLNSNIFTKSESIKLLFPYIVGCSYISLSFLFSVFYLSILIFLITDRKEWKFCYHKIILSLGVADIFQIGFLGSGGVFVLMQKPPNFWVNKIFGAIISSTWFVSLANAHLLAFNRFVNVFFVSHWKERLFNRVSTCVYLIVFWFYGFLWFGFLVWYSEEQELVFSFDSFWWAYSENRLGQVSLQVDFYTDIFHLIGMVIWYSSIYIYLKIKVTKNSIFNCLLQKYFVVDHFLTSA